MAVRGRVFAVQLVLSNAASVAPLLFLGGLADLIGVGPTITLLGASVLVIDLVTTRVHRGWERSEAASSMARRGWTAAVRRARAARPGRPPAGLRWERLTAYCVAGGSPYNLACVAGPRGGIGIRGRLRACALTGVLVRVQSGAPQAGLIGHLLSRVGQTRLLPGWANSSVG